MTIDFEQLSEATLAGYEAKLNQAGYLIFEYEGDWYYNEIGAGDELCDGPYSSRAEVLYLSCKNLHLIDAAPLHTDTGLQLVPSPRNLA
jgi:hypothetical protein